MHDKLRENVASPFILSLSRIAVFDSVGYQLRETLRLLSSFPYRALQCPTASVTKETSCWPTVTRTSRAARHASGAVPSGKRGSSGPTGWSPTKSARVWVREIYREGLVPRSSLLAAVLVVATLCAPPPAPCDWSKRERIVVLCSAAVWGARIVAPWLKRLQRRLSSEGLISISGAASRLRFIQPHFLATWSIPSLFFTYPFQKRSQNFPGQLTTAYSFAFRPFTSERIPRPLLGEQHIVWSCPFCAQPSTLPAETYWESHVTGCHSFGSIDDGDNRRAFFAPENYKRNINSAIHEFEKHTCLKFTKRTTEKNWVKFNKGRG